jgi:ParB-like chromosome segregation protein Spo0J
MKAHPIANVWPMLDDDKLDELAEDIRQQGQLQPIWTFDGMILDGRNRFEACRRAEIKPIIMEYKGDEPTAFAVSLNDRRRHMGKSALAAVAAELEPFFAQDAARRRKETEGRPKKDAEKLTEKLPQVSSSPRALMAREEAAKSVGVNDRYVQDAKKVKAEAPEVFERLKAGKITLQDAKREVAKKPTDDWRKDERDRQERCEGGATVVANASNDKNLIAWAEGEGLAVRVDRGTRYGNPFVLGEDGDRNEVCDAYRLHYLPHKPSIAERAGDLVGKVLICHCYPERCHAEYLVKLARESVKTP